MKPSLVGWLFVLVQVVLLATLILLPRRDDWPTPVWIESIAGLLVAAGLVIAAVAALRLGPSLTPTPMPNSRASLKTDGLYRFVRHPIYTGVLLVVAGITLRSGSWVTLVVAALTFHFFNTKAAWEEARLAERYQDYTAYAAATPRFVPRP